MRFYKKMIMLAISIMVLFSGSAFAATKGPHDALITDNTVCNNCHTLWTNAKNGLYDSKFGSQNDYYNLCMYCHSSGGQSKYDSINGVIFNSGVYYRAPGGGFSRYLNKQGVTSLSGNIASVTSIHNVKGLGTQVSPGSNTGTTYMDFSCRNCHNPHGTTNSRALETTVNGKTDLAPKLIVNNELREETITYISGFNDFCSACHEDFNAKDSGCARNDNGIYSSFKRHRVDFDPSTYPDYNPNHGLPLESGKMTCLTCHYAHSTPVTNGITFSRSGSYNGSSTTNSSTLLRRSNRGVCQACHSE